MVNRSRPNNFGSCEAIAFTYLTYLMSDRNLPRLRGAIAQLGERLHGMQEVVGSIPSGSTKFFSASPSSRGPGHRPFTAVTGVRIPLGTPVFATPVAN